MTSPTFSLHPKLAADTVPVGDLALSRVLLAKDANYPWLILVPRVAAVSDLIDLDAAARAQLWAEIDLAARTLKALAPCDKLNVAALGNIVPQLHIHVIARRQGDAAWPKPVWGTAPPLDYDATARDGFIAALRRALNVTPAG